MKTKFITKEKAFQKLFLFFIIIELNRADDNVCDRRPLGSKTEPLPSDNRFKIDIIGIHDNKYIPNKQYIVKLYSTDNVSTFIAFTISAREDTKYNEKNPRKPKLLDPGNIYPSPESNTLPSRSCNNAVIQSDITPKTSVLAYWRAPPKDNKCVTIYAVLAVKRDVWYNFEGPLSKRVCEDRRNAEDMQPMANDNCQVCEDAGYLLTFEGIWSYNTHPYMFPQSRDLARFSDVVGASHSNNYYIYKDNSDASEGLKALAEQGNTTKLEMEIQSKLGSSVRTIIKATGQPKPNMITNAIFRATREHHLVSLVTAILPSPDWFLGVANMELCDVATDKWAPNLTLNIYPMDAGSDSGLTFESPNEGALPPQPISSAAINSSIPKEDVKPFARLHFELMRTYPKLECITETPDILINKEAGPENKSRETESSTPSNTYSSVSEGTIKKDPTSPLNCPMTAWEDWLKCEGECVDGKLEGYQTRFRYHLVDGVAIGKYVENGPSYEDKEVTQYCLDNYNDVETRKCEDDCGEEEEEEVSAQRRIW